MNLIESINIEFKREYSNDIIKEIVAFANTQGGIIYIGIDDDRSIIGVENPDDVLLQIMNSIRDSIKPDVTLFTSCTIEESLENPVDAKVKELVKIEIQRGANRPYYIADKGLRPSGVYIRQGSASVPASEYAIRQMIKETDGDTYEHIRSFNQDLSFHFISAEMKKHKLKFGHPQMKTLGLKSADGLYTNLGLLLSDQCVHTIKTACFEGTDKGMFKDRREFSGSLLKQLEDAYAYIDIFNKTRSTFSGIDRIDSRDYPPEAIREALLNAIVHREYAFSGSTLVNICDDRIEFVSLGGLVSGLSIEDIMLGISQTRNEKLTNVFYRLKHIEAYGTGITKIFGSYRGSKAHPSIKATDSAFQTILPNSNHTYTYSSSYVKEPAATYGTKTLSNRFTQTKYPEQNPQHEKLIAFLNKEGSMTRTDVQNLLNVGQTRALTILKDMQVAGLIFSAGKGKITEYRIQK